MKSDVFFVSTLFTFGSVILALTIYILLRKEKTQDIKVLGIFFGTNILYIFGYAFELLGADAATKLLFNHVQYIGLPFIVPVWFILSMQFLNKNLKWSWKPILLLFLIPATTLVLNLTFVENGLYYSSFSIERSLGIDVLVYQKGVWYYIDASYKTILMAVTGYLYTKSMISAKGKIKFQTLFLLVLSVAGFLFTGACFFDETTSKINYVCVMLSASSIILFITLFKYELFELVPLAYSKLFDVMDRPFLIVTDTLSVIRANAEAKKLFPLIDSNIKNLSLRELFECEPSNLEALKRSEEYVYMKIIGNGIQYFSVKLISLSASHNKDNIQGYLATFTDTTSHMKQVQKLELLAAGDPLTGLFNRRYFFSVSEAIIEDAKEKDEFVSLIMMDVDNFKYINDTYGHQAGDLILRTVSDVISRQLRSSDVLARFGGDEFVLLLGATSPLKASSVAKRICSAVQQIDSLYDYKHIKLTVSAGVSGGSASAVKDIDTLLTMADRALYDAKSTGRNKVCSNVETDA